jgi:hypothetical protein
MKEKEKKMEKRCVVFFSTREGKKDGEKKKVESLVGLKLMQR